MYYCIPMLTYGGTLLGIPGRSRMHDDAWCVVWLPFLWVLLWSLIHRGRAVSRRRMRGAAAANLGVCVLCIGALAHWHGSRGGYSVLLPLSIVSISGTCSLAVLLGRKAVWTYYLSYYSPILLSLGIVWGSGLHLGSVVVTGAFIGLLCWEISRKGEGRKAQPSGRRISWHIVRWVFRGWLVLGVVAGGGLSVLLAVNSILPLPSQAQPAWAVFAINLDAFLKDEYFIAMIGLCCIPLVWSVISLRRTKERIESIG